MSTFARLGLAAVAVAVVAAAIIAARPAPSVGTGPTPTPTTPASPSTFTSRLYAYSISVPPGWTATGAGTRWSGIGAPTVQDITIDLIDSPDAEHGAAVLVFAAPTSKTLAAYVAAGIATNYVVHRQDGCPEQPESVESITVGGEPAKFVSWNCGVLINTAFTVHAGQGYWFVFRDYAVHAATDPVDKATFIAMLASVQFK